MWASITTKAKVRIVWVSVCAFDLFSSKPLFVPPIHPMLRLGFILKNDDDEPEVHPDSAKSTSTKLKVFIDSSLKTQPFKTIKIKI